MESLRIILALSLFGLSTSTILAFVMASEVKSIFERLDVTKTHQTSTPEKVRKKTKKTRLTKLDKQFRQAGIQQSSRTVLIRYLVLQLLVVILTGILVNWGFALIALSGIHVMLLVILRRMVNKRLKVFEIQLCDAIQIISNAMKSGYSFFQALSRVAEDSQEPLCSAFKQVIKDISLGKTMESAFEQLLEHFPLEDLQLMVSAILIQKEIGGNLSDILDNMLDTLRERQRIQQEVRALTAQGRLSGVIVVSLPFAIMGILFLTSPSYMNTLFTTLTGQIMLGIAGSSQLLGIVAIKKIIRIEY